MNILLTNDDGIECEGLLKLAEALRGRGENTVYVLAPEGNRSGVSHSISLRGPIRIKDYAEDTWTCSGTPADCVMVALLGGLPVIPDLVVSGINAGPNLGTDIIYSGTAAAARQAALHRIPAIALSLAHFGGAFFWDPAVAFVLEGLPDMITLWAEDTFLNVNIPNTPQMSLGTAITYPSRRRYDDRLAVFAAPDGHRYFFIEGGAIATEEEPGSDWEAVSRNQVSISPVFIHPVAGQDMGKG
jgi:5'-nucleotidase